MKLYYLLNEGIKERCVVSGDLKRVYSYVDNGMDPCELREKPVSPDGFFFVAVFGNRYSFAIRHLDVDYEDEFSYEHHIFKSSKRPYCSWTAVREWLEDNDAVQLPNGLSRYAISRDGRLFKLFRKNGELKPAETKPQKITNGYLQFGMVEYCGKTRFLLQHRLLAYMFMGMGWDSKLDIDHINGIKTDNRLDNLRVCTRKDNIWFFRERVVRAFIKNGRNVAKTARSMNITQTAVKNALSAEGIDY